jgi:hypothetical protein
MTVERKAIFGYQKVLSNITGTGTGDLPDRISTG